MKPKVTVRWTRTRKVRITATRGAVTTQATLTEAEANQLWVKLDRLLNGTAGPVAARRSAESVTGLHTAYAARPSHAAPAQAFGFGKDVT